MNDDDLSTPPIVMAVTLLISALSKLITPLLVVKFAGPTVVSVFVLRPDPSLRTEKATCTCGVPLAIPVIELPVLEIINDEPPTPLFEGPPETFPAGTI